MVKDVIGGGLKEVIPDLERIGGLFLSMVDLVESLSPLIEVAGVALMPFENLLRVMSDSIAFVSSGFAGLLNMLAHGVDSAEVERSYKRTDAAAHRLYDDVNRYGGLPDIHVHQTINVDTHEIATDIARKTVPAVHEARERIMQDYQASKLHEKVRRGMGGH